MQNNDIIFYLWLTQIKGFGPVLCRKLLDYYKEPREIYNLSQNELMKVESIGTSLASKIINSRDLTCANNIYNDCIKKDIKISTVHDESFPSILNQYKDAPIVLYYKGNLNKNIKGVGIVGARRCTEYGKTIAIESASYLAKQGIPVISGMAKGIDGYAHTACLKENGYTIAVLGCGVDICYPKEHAELMKKITQNGAVISEYPPGVGPEKRNFPKRNKIISLLSEKLLVVEASENSGAIITAEYAKKYNKTVLAPPNNKFIISSKGTNKLIKEGTEMYLEPSQLLIEKINFKHDLDINSQINKEKNNVHSDIELQILELLNKKSLTIDEIVQIFRTDRNKIIDSLFTLELSGEVNAISGGKYAIESH